MTTTLEKPAPTVGPAPRHAPIPGPEPEPPEPPEKEQTNPRFNYIFTDDATAINDEYAIDPQDHLWFISIIGSAREIRKIITTITNARHIEINPTYLETSMTTRNRQCRIPQRTRQMWAVKYTGLPRIQAAHAILYPQLAELYNNHQDFLLLLPPDRNPAEQHFRFLNRRTTLPIHPDWADWLWQRGIESGEITPLETMTMQAWYCQWNEQTLKEHLSIAIANKHLPIPEPKTARE